jgi:CheY-like chemotaxis protein
MPPLSVLIIEDDPLTRETFSDALRLAGFEVAGVPTMAAALERLTGRPVQVIVTDLRLPDIATLDTVAALRARAPDSRIVVCSGFVTPELRRYARGFGAVAVLEKPVELARLLAAVSGAP